jgi:hypothetical protein
MAFLCSIFHLYASREKCRSTHQRIKKTTTRTRQNWCDANNRQAIWDDGTFYGKPIETDKPSQQLSCFNILGNM